MNKILKSYLLHLAMGIATVVLIGAFLLTISLDMRWMSVFGIVLSFLAGFFLNRKSRVEAVYLKTILLALPYAIFFWMVIKTDLPSLWFTIPAFYLSGLLGALLFRNKPAKRWLIIADIALAVTMFLTIPIFVSGDLMQETNETGASFELIDHDGNIIESESLIGQAVVLDFYGTWCKPCIYELPELAKVKSQFSEQEVKFYVVNSDQLGDNLEKAKRFATRYDMGFDYIYDYKGKVYKSLGFVPNVDGVPSLVVLDKQGNIRLRHVGYNKSETDFVENITHLLKDILAE